MKKLHLKKEFIIREVAGEKILLPTGVNSVDYSKMIVLNDSANLLIELLQRKDGTDTQELLQVLMDNYEVDEQTALKDIEELLGVLSKENLLEE